MSSNIYRGPRDDTFKILITNMLKRGKVKKRYIEWFNTQESLELYDQAFTAKSADLKRNYEQLEQLGDLSANKFIVSYAYTKFPQYDCPEGTVVGAQLRINYGAKKTFAYLADQLGFWNFITAKITPDTNNEKKCRENDRNGLLEDCLESFMGCTEKILDTRTQCIGVGYHVVYNMLTSIFDQYITMDTSYEGLFDSRTRLKQIYDKTQNSAAYVTNKINTGDSTYILETNVYETPKNQTKPFTVQQTGQQRAQSNWTWLAKSNGTNKDKSEAAAAEEAIKAIEKRQGKLPIKDIYTKGCTK